MLSPNIVFDVNQNVSACVPRFFGALPDDLGIFFVLFCISRKAKSCKTRNSECICLKIVSVLESPLVL